MKKGKSIYSHINYFLSTHSVVGLWKSTTDEWSGTGKHHWKEGKEDVETGMRQERVCVCVCELKWDILLFLYKDFFHFIFDNLKILVEQCTALTTFFQ